MPDTVALMIAVPQEFASQTVAHLKVLAGANNREIPGMWS